VVRLEARHLRTLDAIARAGSLTRAATALGVSQPAVTMQLARIERMLGAEVFTRRPHGITPTPFGEFVLARTRAALADVDDILAARPGGEVSAVRVGGFGGPVPAALAARLPELLPGVRTALHPEYFTRLLFDLVAERRLDVALVTDYPGHELRPVPGVERRTVATEPVFVALSARHPLARRDELDLAELAGRTWVLPPSDGTGWPEHFLEVCAEHALSPQVRYRMVDDVMRRGLIAAGRALAPCQWTFPAGDDVVVRPVAGDPLRMRYLLIWHSDGPVAAYADRLLDLARDVYRAASQDTLSALGRASRRPVW
jgi:DNA-binding transcriptional LysR family regulator